jgi:para-aminobenzoate synthetase component 1
MRTLIHECAAPVGPEAVAEQLQGEPGLVLLRSGGAGPGSRYSFLAARPFLTFQSFGSRCRLESAEGSRVLFGSPWHLLERVIERYEVLEELDSPFPAGGCFGFWGYDLKNFVEPKVSRRASNDLELPDSWLGFYDSLAVWDHALGKSWILATGLAADGTRTEPRALAQCRQWERRLALEPGSGRGPAGARISTPQSNLAREDFIGLVRRAQAYIRSGDIYQVNLSHRLTAECGLPAFNVFRRLGEVSPAPYSGFLDAGAFQLASSSPELFLRLSGAHITTRPIKGTRPRSADPTRDAQLSYELLTSPKETAELVMITDLLRNDLGRVCEFGSVHVPDLMTLERFPHVQHLVATVEGRLRPKIAHLEALRACFPGGSITGAPKFRAMEIIDELEPVSRGPYTGAFGYLGFNRESQLSIIIRTALLKDGLVHFHVGAGIVADSSPEAEYDETMAKAGGFLDCLRASERGGDVSSPFSAHDRGSGTSSPTTHPNP